MNAILLLLRQFHENWYILCTQIVQILKLHLSCVALMLKVAKSQGILLCLKTLKNARTQCPWLTMTCCLFLKMGQKLKYFLRFSHLYRKKPTCILFLYNIISSMGSSREWNGDFKNSCKFWTTGIPVGLVSLSSSWILLQSLGILIKSVSSHLNG